MRRAIQSLPENEKLALLHKMAEAIIGEGNDHHLDWEDAIGMAECVLITIFRFYEAQHDPH